MILYGYALSSASYRVRIALALKGLQVTSVPVNLRSGEQRLQPVLQINSQGVGPSFVLGGPPGRGDFALGRAAAGAVPADQQPGLRAYVGHGRRGGAHAIRGHHRV